MLSPPDFVYLCNMGMYITYMPIHQLLFYKRRLLVKFPFNLFPLFCNNFQHCLFCRNFFNIFQQRQLIKQITVDFFFVCRHIISSPTSFLFLTAFIIAQTQYKVNVYAVFQAESPQQFYFMAGAFQKSGFGVVNYHFISQPQMSAATAG